jgi:hypothetical protein
MDWGIGAATARLMAKPKGIEASRTPSPIPDMRPGRYISKSYGYIFFRAPKRFVRQFTDPNSAKIARTLSVARSISHRVPWQPPFDRSLDETGCEEGKRDRHVDVALAALLTRRDLSHIGDFARYDLVEPAVPSRDRTDETGAALNPGWSHLIAGNAMRDQDLSEFVIHILAAVAEHEARMISDRTRAALAAAKARGVNLGGWRGRAGTCSDLAQARATRTDKAIRRASDLKNTIEEIRHNGAQSLCAIPSGLNERGITAPRGGFWCAAQVKRVLSRLTTTGPVLP